MKHKFIYILIAASAIAATGLAQAQVPQWPSLESMKLGGDVLKRLKANLGYEQKLGLRWGEEGVRLANLLSDVEATRLSQSYLDSIVTTVVPAHLNERGYLGPIYPSGAIDPHQQEGNHSLLLALEAYRDWKRDEQPATGACIAAIESIGQYLKVTGYSPVPSHEPALSAQFLPDSATTAQQHLDRCHRAMLQWQSTGRPQWLERAQLDYYNGVGAMQQADGGFGDLQCHTTGLAWWARQAVASAGDTIYINHPATAVFNVGGISMLMQSWYPIEGKVQMLMLADSKPMTLKFFMPSWVDGVQVVNETDGKKPYAFTIDSLGRYLTIKASFHYNELVTITFNISDHTVALRDGHIAVFHGPLQMGNTGKQPPAIALPVKLKAINTTHWKVVGTKLVLQPLYNLMSKQRPRLGTLFVNSNENQRNKNE